MSRRASGQRRRGAPAPARRAREEAPPRLWPWALLPAALAAVVYTNALHNPFVYDDVHTIQGNPSLQDLHNWRWVLLYNRFRPLVNVSYALDRAYWGTQ